MELFVSGRPMANLYFKGHLKIHHLLIWALFQCFLSHWKKKSRTPTVPSPSHKQTISKPCWFHLPNKPWIACIFLLLSLCLILAVVYFGSNLFSTLLPESLSKMKISSPFQWLFKDKDKNINQGSILTPLIPHMEANTPPRTVNFFFLTFITTITLHLSGFFHYSVVPLDYSLH